MTHYGMQWHAMAIMANNAIITIEVEKQKQILPVEVEHNCNYRNRNGRIRMKNGVKGGTQQLC